MNEKDFRHEKMSEQQLIEGRLRMKIIDAQKLLMRNEKNVNPILYTELMTILERPTTDLSDEELEKSVKLIGT